MKLIYSITSLLPRTTRALYARNRIQLGGLPANILLPWPSGKCQCAQRATSTAKAAVAVVEARNRLKAFPSVEGTSSLDLRERKACVFRLGSFPLDRLL
ncbi:hypothetical protein V6N12_066806 [Hibiscus sabdariffa]|uniref:Uncharacterized protein n=1 Tax=Hibiscus sabdariffa TaxID=183260 RepID=A0ABR2C9Y3_9ROSI